MKKKLSDMSPNNCPGLIIKCILIHKISSSAYKFEYLPTIRFATVILKSHVLMTEIKY